MLLRLGLKQLIEIGELKLSFGQLRLILLCLLGEALLVVSGLGELFVQLRVMPLVDGA